MKLLRSGQEAEGENKVLETELLLALKRLWEGRRPGAEPAAPGPPWLPQAALMFSMHLNLLGLFSA